MQIDGISALIAQLRAESNAAIAMHDVEKIGSFVHPQAKIIPAGASEPFNGRDEMCRALESQFGQYPDVVYTRMPAEIKVAENLQEASESGLWLGRYTESNQKKQLTGSYNAMWKKFKDQWLLTSEKFDNSPNGEG